MFLARVRGDLVATLKHEALRGRRLLWVEAVPAAAVTRRSPRAGQTARSSEPPGDGELRAPGPIPVAVRPGASTKRPLLAVDTVDAGPGDLVLVLDEGNGAAQVLGRPRGPIRTVIVGVVDEVAMAEEVTSSGQEPGGACAGAS